MPGLASVQREFSDRVGFIGLLHDYGTNLSGARRVTESAGVDRSFIMVDFFNSDVRILDELINSNFVPSAILIGGDGQVITERFHSAHAEMEILAVLGE
jgi:hypothetical protein